MPNASPKKENMFVSLLMNIVVPALLLTQGAKLGERFDISVSPATILISALAFPLGYFIWDFLRTRQTNWISVIGFAGTLLTGGIGLFQLSPLWVAVKEASIPLFIAIVMIFSRKMIRTFLFNGNVFDVPAIEAAVAKRGKNDLLDTTLTRCSRILTASFLLSTVLNFVLARLIVRTEPAADSVAFNEEIGKMLALSWPVIVLPCTVFIFVALWILVKGLTQASGLSFEELLKKNS